MTSLNSQNLVAQLPNIDKEMQGDKKILNYNYQCKWAFLKSIKIASKALAIFANFEHLSIQKDIRRA